MTITYPLAFPRNIDLASISLGYTTASVLSESPFTFKQQAVSHAGQRINGRASFPPMNKDDAGQVIGFLMSLQGVRGTFLMGDPSRQTPSGVGGGTPLVNGAGQTGQQLIIDGAPNSTTGWLKAGDYVQLGSGGATSLHTVLQDVSTDASGNATLDLFPKLRTSPADNAALTISNTVGLWRLNSNQQNWDVNDAAIYGISFGFFEAVT